MVVLEHEYQKVYFLLVPEEKLLPIHGHDPFHYVICVSGEAHTGFFFIWPAQAAGKNSTRVIP